jgi:general secretion pathway protein J
VLIAMTLLSIMVMLLFGSLKICADSWEKGESKITDVNEIAVVYNFFQRHLSQAKPLWNDLSEEEKTFSFQGNSQSLQFVSAFPASAARSGLQLFSINLAEEDNDQVINVALTPFFPTAEGEEWHKEEVTLTKHVSGFTLAYFGSDDGVSEGAWAEEWLNKDVLPRLVKVNISLDNGIYWPEMIIDLRVTGKSDNPDAGPNNNANPRNIN